MPASKRQFQTIDEYIAAQPKNVQSVLQEIRQTINGAAPEAEETISYRMPAFELNGILVWFAAFKHHVGFYPKVSAIKAFKEKLGKYKVGKGTIQFQLSQPIPYELLKEIVKFRVKENTSKKDQN